MRLISPSTALTKKFVYKLYGEFQNMSKRSYSNLITV